MCFQRLPSQSNCHPERSTRLGELENIGSIKPESLNSSQLNSRHKITPPLKDTVNAIRLSFRAEIFLPLVFMRVPRFLSRGLMNEAPNSRREGIEAIVLLDFRRSRSGQIDENFRDDFGGARGKHDHSVG